MRNLWFLAGIAGTSLLLAGRAMAQEEASGNPLDVVAVDMKVVVVKLNALTTGKPTQEKQKQIVAKLDELIAQLDKECAACRSGASGNRPTKPLSDSVIMGGPGGIGDLHAAKQSGKKWGELPAKERDRILQSMTEGFPAHYQTLLERYYRRLAEEKPTADSAAAKPAVPAGATSTKPAGPTGNAAPADRKSVPAAGAAK